MAKVSHQPKVGIFFNLSVSQSRMQSKQLSGDYLPTGFGKAAPADTGPFEARQGHGCLK